MTAVRLPSSDAAVAWLARRGAAALASDSRRVRPGDAFIAWPGQVHDARAHVAAALAAGAVACLVEADGVERFAFDDERIAALDGLKSATGPIASRFLGVPSERLRVVACTGTNGKTSSAWWTAQALTRLGVRCGVVGTLGIGEPPRAVRGAATTSSPAGASAATTPASPDPSGLTTPASPDPSGLTTPASLDASGLTTPDPIVLQSALRRFVDAGFGAVALEASSIGIAEHRLDGTRIDTALFTNFTQDHLDYHVDMATYWDAKARLFDWPGLRAAVINVDDLHGLGLAERLAGSGLDLWTCSQAHGARLRATGVRHLPGGGIVFDVEEAGERVGVEVALIGHFNVANVLGVLGALRAAGIDLADAAAACRALTPVPGRMERVAQDAAVGPEVVVDYAHTPDALDQALAALRPLATERGGKLWCVFGCGGDRDPGKRPLMGAIACRLADHVVLTSDNPRGEAPDFIISQILAGVVGHDEVDVIENRAEAIGHAVLDADARDVVMLAGKGHEPYQEIGGVKQPFSDVEQARRALRERASKRSVTG